MSELYSTYDPKEVVIAWNGIPINSGIAPDTFLSIIRSEDAFTKKVGANGKVVRTRNADKTGEVEITLMQNSPVNTLLAAAAIADEEAGTDIVSTITVSDPSGSLLAMAEQAWIRKIPDQELAKEYGERTWQFDAGEIRIISTAGIV